MDISEQAQRERERIIALDTMQVRSEAAKVGEEDVSCRNAEILLSAAFNISEVLKLQQKESSS
ncbi:PWWP domain [Musa troglodytarum]|uniref:PWWP domain n=1 Tax=Musa troglodytarum TaxID=320322 RepID=A0A9E7HVJ1_9LILI|nr:PWWP domain [Musa troglodytarum]